MKIGSISHPSSLFSSLLPKLRASSFKPGFVLPIMVVNRLGAAENAYFAMAWTMSTVYFSVKRVQKQLRPVIIITALAAAVTLALAYILMPRYGIDGVGIAWLAGQGVVAGVVGWRIAQKASFG